jgi:hypothetical protein
MDFKFDFLDIHVCQKGIMSHDYHSFKWKFLKKKLKSLVFNDKIWHSTPFVAPFIVFD